MKFVLEIDSENAALSDADYPVGDELARMLHALANQINGSDLGSLDGFQQRLRDTNGNVVGKATVLPQAVHVPTEALSIVQEIAEKAPSDALRQLADLAFEARKPYQY
ncbi:MAG: hypothetical protein EPN74_14295 [Rhodanobacter sp.]|nr:MAG: hypothetical protein EPN74_14295 [Rhodanobacter sp.]